MCRPASSKVPDLFERELIIGTPGGAQGVSAAPILLRNLLHMRLKIIQGYHSPGDVILAMARREVEGVVQTLGAPEGARRQWIESGQMRVMFNMEHERVAGLDAPTIFEFIKTRGGAPGPGLLLLQHGARPAADGAARRAGRAGRAAARRLRLPS